MVVAYVLLTGAVGALPGDSLTLRGDGGVEAIFAPDGQGGLRWTAYRHLATGREWPIKGPRFSLQTPDGRRTNLADCSLRPSDAGSDRVVLETALEHPTLRVRQTYAFAADGRTLRIRTELRALAAPVLIQRLGLLELEVPGQTFERIGPEHVSCPIVGDGIFAGIEHPAAICQVDGSAFYLAQHAHLTVGSEWTPVPCAVFGAAAEGQTVRQAFLCYLDTVRVKPTDLHVHYNNWWTMPVPFSEQDVLDNIAELRKGLYDATGLFFDSYAMDMGWSDPHSVWEVDAEGYPNGFGPIREALAVIGARPGLWVSPSSLYPPALDNAWLSEAGYEVSAGSHLGRFACLARGGRYQTAFKEAVLKHAREGRFGHVKFDGLAWPCNEADHGHQPGLDSFQPIAEGLADVFDALRAHDPTIALEPTCLGYYPSPWWLLHTPFVIGPFGDDAPRGRCPSPEWLESLTTARDIAILSGRDAFWMPSSALECFDTIIQCPGDVRNHLVMAVGRGHWFLSNYINPRCMDEDSWRFFADLIRWARANREELQDPMVFGGEPSQWEPYGYAFLGAERGLFFVRNPWIEEADIALPWSPSSRPTELRALYPRREVICRTAAGAAAPQVRLGPYELLVLEAVPTHRSTPPLASARRPAVEWLRTAEPSVTRRVFVPDPPAFGPSWTSPDGDVTEVLEYSGAGRLRLDAPAGLCLLVEGALGAGVVIGRVEVDGREVGLRRSGSRGAFYAAQARPEEEWEWLLADIPAGTHEITYSIRLPEAELRCGAFLRGETEGPHRVAPFAPGQPFPVKTPETRGWSHTMEALVPVSQLPAVEVTQSRRLEHIDGVYLDALEWESATSGWGVTQRCRSITEAPMIMEGRRFHRGLGAHANSRIVYQLPGGFLRLAATIGCDQAVHANTVVFVVEGDGRELYRSPVMRRDTPVIDIDIRIADVTELALILEDAGDGIIADHGNWADARLLH